LIYDWFQHIRFAHPYFLGLLALLPVAILWYYRRKRVHGSLRMSTLGGFAGGSNWKTKLRQLPFYLRLLALACIIVALARPQETNQEEQVKGEGVDIVLCMDVSGSMLAQDFTPNRLEAAKAVAVNFIDSRLTDRIGLVIFSGESFTQCPLTSDRSVLKTQVFNINNAYLDDGTAIGEGLANSVGRLKASNTKSKVIILLTDGENNKGLIDPKTAKEMAKSERIKVYTIGVGTEGMAPVPQQTAFGVVMGREKVNIDEPLLREIAAETGGKYYRAKENTELKNIYTEIDKLEKSKVEITRFNRYTEKFLPFVLAAIGLLLLELLLSLTVFRKFP
jgi:Ca-activated chloride channel homolog